MPYTLMGIITETILKDINQKAKAKILVKCPKCKDEFYVPAIVGAQLEVIEPNLKKRICNQCKKTVNFKRL